MNKAGPSRGGAGEPLELLPTWCWHHSSADWCPPLSGYDFATCSPSRTPSAGPICTYEQEMLSKRYLIRPNHPISTGRASSAHRKGGRGLATPASILYKVACLGHIHVASWKARRCPDWTGLADVKQTVTARYGWFVTTCIPENMSREVGRCGEDPAPHLCCPLA